MNIDYKIQIQIQLQNIMNIGYKIQIQNIMATMHLHERHSKVEAQVATKIALKGIFQDQTIFKLVIISTIDKTLG